MRRLETGLNVRPELEKPYKNNFNKIILMYISIIFAHFDIGIKIR